MTTVNKICNAMREANSLTHYDLQCINAAYAALIKNSGVLSDKTTAIVVDLIDCEVLGQIDNDQEEKQVEAANLEQQQERRRYPARLELDARYGMAA
jgi:hypothetical protein